MKTRVNAVASGHRRLLNCALCVICLLAFFACDRAAKPPEPEPRDAEKHSPFKGAMLRWVGTSEFPAPGIEVVDPWLGTVAIDAFDLLQRSGALRVELRRSYYDKSQWTGLLGSKWRLNWEVRLIRAGDFVVVDSPGAITNFRSPSKPDISSRQG